jgi:integrase
VNALLHVAGRGEGPAEPVAAVRQARCKLAVAAQRPNARLALRLIRTYALPSLGGLRVDRVRPAHVEAILDAATAKGLAPRTVRQVRAALSSAFSTAARWGLVAVNPVRATTSPTPAKPDLVTPTAAQLRGIADAAEGTPWAVPVLLAATTGCRQGEALALRWANVSRGDLGEGV